MSLWKKSLTLSATGTLTVALLPVLAFADTEQAIPQGTGPAVLQQANYFGDLPPDTPVTVDIVMKVQNPDSLQSYIRQTVTPGQRNFRNYLSVSQFREQFGPKPAEIQALTNYLASFGIQTTVYPDNLIITANGTVSQFNKAFNVRIQSAKLGHKSFHATKTNPMLPAGLAKDVLCVLGLTNYSDFTSQAVKPPVPLSNSGNTPQGPLTLTPQDLVQHYDVGPLYQRGATGAGQTIGIVTLAEFNQDDAYKFWNDMGIPVKRDRISTVQVDGGSGWDGYDETTLDVEQSGALAPQADIRVYVGPNSDTGFVDTFATAINENVAQQISVSWGTSETAIELGIQQQIETPAYAQVFNELFMQAAAQGISMFAASGDNGAYAAESDAGTYNLSTLSPADSPYITAAGGTTLPFHFHSAAANMDVEVPQERAWGWDYLYSYFDARGFNTPDTLWLYFIGSGGGFSDFFPTPDYQQGVPGVNRFTAVQWWTPSPDNKSVTRNPSPVLVTGSNKGRNLPDLAMNADPYTGYLVYLSDEGVPDVKPGYVSYGGTSVVAPQLAGLTALINDADGTRVGFWNPQIYRFAQQPNSPFTPLDTTGTSNDNLYFTGTPGTVYNQATGLGIPDIAKLADRFASHG